MLALLEAQHKTKNLATLAVVALCALTLLLCAAGLLTDPEQREEPFRAALVFGRHLLRGSWLSGVLLPVPQRVLRLLLLVVSHWLPPCLQQILSWELNEF